MTVRRRTKGRECALKILYAVNIRKDTAAECMDDFWKNQGVKNDEVREFASYLVAGVTENIHAIDEMLRKYATNWQLERMAVVDKNIMRIAAFELLYADNIPAKVTINEAVEMAKKYGDKDSSKFVNGILDKINKDEAKKP
ncbi:MAG: transcription antitermination factor NusB [Candidatus Omnitrophota bacterium]